MPDSDPPGSSYMLVFGFVQALSIQQDAVRDLHSALGVSYRPDPVLGEIRGVRNAVTHQTDGQNKKKEFRLAETGKGRSCQPDGLRKAIPPTSRAKDARSLRSNRNDGPYETAISK